MIITKQKPFEEMMGLHGIHIIKSQARKPPNLFVGRNCMEYKHSRNQVFLINYHLVWCPKRRKKVLVNKIAKRLKEIFNQVAKDKDIDIFNS
jgi:hypothetical protein